MGVGALFEPYILRGSVGYQFNRKLNFDLKFTNYVGEHIFLSIKDRTCLSSLREFFIKYQRYVHWSR